MARTETVTVVFTDLVGSTELASRLGHDAYEALRHEHFAALRTPVTKHGGTEEQTTGDRRARSGYERLETRQNFAHDRHRGAVHQLCLSRPPIE